MQTLAFVAISMAIGLLFNARDAMKRPQAASRRLTPVSGRHGVWGGGGGVALYAFSAPQPQV
jgi:hypothetical protein